jgi:hypothetical protein
MKNINKTLGVISVIVLIIGIIFKKSHWPGASVIMSVSALALFVFFITYLFIGIKALSTGIEKASGISAGVAMCLALAAFLFKVQHWPGAGVLIFVSLLALIVTGIILIIDSIMESDQAKQSIKTAFAFSLTVIALILIMIIEIFPIIQK